MEEKKHVNENKEEFEQINNEKVGEIDNMFMCDPCDGESKAVSYCPECEEFLCEECVKSHKKMKATKQHEIVPAEMSKDHKNLPSEIKGKNFPGIPRAARILPDSVVLEWEPPTNFSDKEFYQLSFKDIRNDRRWKTYHEEVQDHSISISGLKSNATYVFRVRVIHEDGEESPFSTESDEICTTTSLAAKMVATSKKLSGGEKAPVKYALPIKEIESARNQQAKTRKFEIGTPPSGHVESKTIMLVGATGTGKSTFVDGIINYVLGVTWEDPFRYTIINLEPEEKAHMENQAVSQTEWITCYKIHPESGSRLSYQLQIIDTPGFGDTRGLKRDKQIIDQIRQLFSDQEPKGVTCIDAVCFLIKAPDARLTAIQSYIFQSIMSLFGKDIEKNICSLITFADGSDPPVLAALAKSNLPFGKYFTFNNSALFASNSSSDCQGLSPMFWNIGMSSFNAFFIHLDQMRSTSLQQTKEVLLERQRLEAVVRTLKENLDVGLKMVDILKSDRKLLEQYKVAMEDNKDFEIEVEKTTFIRTLIPGGVHNTKCENCYVKCHPHCVFTDDEDKKYCCAMDANGNCTICPDRCSWRAHKNDAYTHIQGTTMVKTTLKKHFEKYTDASDKALSHQQIVAKNEAQLLELTHNIEDMMLVVKYCNEMLTKNALRPNPLTMTEHIDLMIENEKLTKKQDYQLRIKVLEEFRKDAEVYKDVEIFKNLAAVQVQDMDSKLQTQIRPKDIQSVLKRGATWFKNHIPGFSF